MSPLRRTMLNRSCRLLAWGCLVMLSAEVLAKGACVDNPLGKTELYLRGSMNNWAIQDEYQFNYECDAFYLNINASARHDFKIGDAQWSESNTFGAASNADREAAQPRPGLAFRLTRGRERTQNLNFAFGGDHTVRFVPPHDGMPAVVQIGPRTYVDPSLRPPSNPIARSVRYDSRQLAFKRPFGAATRGTDISFTLAALPGIRHATLVIERRRLEGNQDVLDYHEPLRLPMVATRVGRTEHWTVHTGFDQLGIYGYYFELDIAGQTYIYQNNGDPIFWTREKGSNGPGVISLLTDDSPAARRRIRRYRQTIYSPDFQVPAWASDAVYYYIFPERFRNGDRSNDPRPGVDTYQDKPVEFHRNWLEKPFRPGSGDGSDNVYCNDFFGGDIAGIIEKLDYIAQLGANTLYITPMFRAASNHKYDTTDYRHIDPHFGSDEDFIRLTQEAARRGIRVIPDTSLNHTGSDSLYFDRFGKYDSHGAFRGAHIDPQSPYADWYRFDASQSDPDRQYTGWIGVQDLPELNKSSPDFRAFAFGNRDSIMKLWLDRGAAGWRMDVAPWVPDDFWREWRTAVKSHRPDALTIAEAYFDAAKFFLGDEFDTTMNYIFSSTIQAYAAGGDARKLYQNIELMRESYPRPAFQAAMNLLSSHDVPRALFQFGYTDEQTPASQVQRAKQKLRLAALVQMSFPGAPAIYYGDEVGVTGGEDPYNRATYPWEDQGGKPDQALLADYRRLIAMRKQFSVLRQGDLSAPIQLDAHVIVFWRRAANAWALVALNNDQRAHRINLALPSFARRQAYRDAWLNTTGSTGERLNVTIPAYFGKVLIGGTSSSSPD